MMDKRREKIVNFISTTVMRLELILAVILIIGVLINALSLVPLLVELVHIDPTSSYDLFQQFLAFVLLLLIGLELAVMLIRHDAFSVVQVMIYAVARKMLIYNTTSQEILLGSISLAVLFLINKYLINVEK